MKNLKDFINEAAQKSSSDKLYDLFVKEMKSVDFEPSNIQDTLTYFLKKCFNDLPAGKDANIAVGDAVLSIYEEFVK